MLLVICKYFNIHCLNLEINPNYGKFNAIKSKWLLYGYWELNLLFISKSNSIVSNYSELIVFVLFIGAVV